jgi:pullulanase-type alpha-1,6-glucosidase
MVDATTRSARHRLLTLGAAVAVTAGLAQPAAAHHTPVPEVVTLVGSLQSELGCPGDWQPECPATRLEPVTGRPGVYRGTFTPPAGGYEYKVALGGTWDENYGAGGAPGGANLTLTARGAPVTVTYDHATHVVSDDTPKILGAERAAHWLRRGLVAWDLPDARDGHTYRLVHAPEGGLAVTDGAITGGTAYPLTPDPAGLPADVRRDVPHLAGYEALRLPAGAQRRAPELLTGQLVVADHDATGALVATTGLQLPGVLDDVYRGAEREELGVTWHRGTPRLSVWAPTAKAVSLLLRPSGSAADSRIAMRRNANGVWTATGPAGWRGAAYRYDVRVYVPATGAVETNVVTDPYSVALTVDSAASVVADLDDPRLAPAGWRTLAKPAARGPLGAVSYELHVRDFSVTDETVPAAHRGTFLAFTDTGSAGMRHLRSLARNGATHVQVLPAFDLATVPERRADQATPPCDLAQLPPDSEQQQACVEETRPTDGFNWGYDPWHYSTPEGSYAIDQDGPGRTREFRSMVAGLNRAGLRVVMDVVYNHTTASGQDPKSVLDRVVPGYYHRLTATGEVETSTCCQNTATEHLMMQKLMVDSIVTWARDYKVDAFRFDLMGHHSKANMLAVRAALDRLTPARDGVDGRQVYVFGEGWNFGEVADGARFVQATQANLAGTGIGTFSDRLRDAVRGGGPFDENPRVQGFGSGLFTDPNGDPVNGTPDEQRARLLHHQDLVKLGLAGNLRDYAFVDRTGATVRGDQVDYNGQPAGYAGGPADTVTYVDAHDNETLFDALQYKLPQATPMAGRVRMNTVSLAASTLAQGVTMWHAGSDLLRSKSLDRNSYDSGDWFNRIDWTARESTWGSGLPPAADNAPKWPYARPLLADPALRPGPRDLATAAARAGDLLRIRQSSPLFRLPTAAAIRQRVGFPLGGPAQTPGVVVMTLDDTAGADLDRRWERIVVVLNASPAATTQTVPGQAGRAFGLHPVQAGGGDPVVRTSGYDRATGSFRVPARTAAVFVSP